MNFIKKYKYDLFFAALVLGFVIFFTMTKENFGMLSDRESFSAYIRSFGLFAPIVIIMIIILEVIVAPLPGFVPATAAGFIFGPIEGSLYAYIGNVIGSTIVFLLVRKYGKSFVERLAEKRRVEKYEKMVEKRSHFLFLFYFLPILPTDIISIAIGLSDIGFKRFFKIMAIGFIINVLFLSLFGDYLARLFF